MRKDAGVDGDAQRISQLGWMLFLKIFDEKENDWEILNDNYKSPIPKDLRWRNWAAARFASAVRSSRSPVGFLPQRSVASRRLAELAGLGLRVRERSVNAA